MSESDQLLARITATPGVLVGKPVIAGTRLSVVYIVGQLAYRTEAEILAEYPGLETDDIRACLLVASRAMDDTFRRESRAHRFAASPPLPLPDSP